MFCLPLTSAKSCACVAEAMEELYSSAAAGGSQTVALLKEHSAVKLEVSHEVLLFFSC